MFTGIIEEIGKIKKIQNKRSTRILAIENKIVHQNSKIGDSISVNGVCLTLTTIEKNILMFDVITQTVSNTNLKDLKING